MQGRLQFSHLVYYNTYINIMQCIGNKQRIGNKRSQANSETIIHAYTNQIKL